jgi:hypothetical protein
MAHLTANIGLRTGVVFDLINLDSEAAVDALEAARDGRERIRGPVVATAKSFTPWSCRPALATVLVCCRASISAAKAGTS